MSEVDWREWDRLRRLAASKHRENPFFTVTNRRSFEDHKPLDTVRIFYRVSDGDAASCCRHREWADSLLVASHLMETDHFRNWCLEHLDLVRGRFPDAVELVTEEVLSGDT